MEILYLATNVEYIDIKNKREKEHRKVTLFNTSDFIKDCGWQDAILVKARERMAKEGRTI